MKHISVISKFTEFTQSIIMKVNFFLKGVQVSFDPESYMVSEGNQRELRVIILGEYGVPVELLLSTTGLTATGIST